MADIRVATAHGLVPNFADGPQTVTYVTTDTGALFTPKFVVGRIGRGDVSGQLFNHNTMTCGFSDGTNERFIWHHSTLGASATQARRSRKTARFMSIISADGETQLGRGQVVGFTTQGGLAAVQVAWDQLNGGLLNRRLIVLELWGGDDLSHFVDTSPPLNLGNQRQTIPSAFTPDSVFVQSSGQGSGTGVENFYTFCEGWADVDALNDKQVATYGTQVNSRSTSSRANAANEFSRAFIGQMNASTANNFSWQTNDVRPEAGGWSLFKTDNPANDVLDYIGLALGGAGRDAGTFNTPSGPGTVQVRGLDLNGNPPGYIWIGATNRTDLSDGSVTRGSAANVLGIITAAASDEGDWQQQTKSLMVRTQHNANNNPSEATTVTTDGFVGTLPGGAAYRGYISAVVADGFDITFTESPDNVAWVFFAIEESDAGPPVGDPVNGDLLTTNLEDQPALLGTVQQPQPTTGDLATTNLTDVAALTGTVQSAIPAGVYTVEGVETANLGNPGPSPESPTTGTHDVPLPPGNIGDLLVMLVGFRGNQGAPTPPAGWTQIDTNLSFSTVRTSIFARYADGTEGPTAQVLSDGNRWGQAHTYRFNANFVRGDAELSDVFAESINHEGTEGGAGWRRNPPECIAPWGGEAGNIWICGFCFNNFFDGQYYPKDLNNNQRPFRYGRRIDNGTDAATRAFQVMWLSCYLFEPGAVVDPNEIGVPFEQGGGDIPRGTTYTIAIRGAPAQVPETLPTYVSHMVV